MELRNNYKKLGDYIREIDVRNKGLRVTRLLGVSNEKYFIPSIANIVGTDLSNYKIVKRNQFAFGTVTSRNGDKLSIAILKEDECIVSSSYVVFEVIDESKLNPDYLMMWLRREEFDRYARFMSHGSVRELFGWDKLCDVELPIPDIEEQLKYVNDYESIQNAIKIKEAINNNLLEQGCALCKSVFPITEETNHRLEEFFPIITGKKNTEVAGIEGKYPFFSCSQDILYTNEYSFEGSAILLAGNGDFNIKFYSGKFEAYQRTYVLIPYNSKLCGLIFFIMKANIDKITKGNRGSVISFIVKGMISDFKITLPDNYINYKEIDMLNELLNFISINDKEIVNLHKLQETLLRSIAQK